MVFYQLIWFSEKLAHQIQDVAIKKNLRFWFSDFFAAIQFKQYQYTLEASSGVKYIKKNLRFCKWLINYLSINILFLWML